MASTEPSPSGSRDASALAPLIKLVKSKPLATAAVGVAAIVLVAFFAARSGSGSNALTVLVQFSETQYGSVSCEAGNKIDRQVAGGSVTVLDASGTRVATATLPSATGELTAEESGTTGGGCEWEVNVSDVPSSDVYSVELDLPGGYTDSTDFDSSTLESSGWVADFQLTN